MLLRDERYCTGASVFNNPDPLLSYADPFSYGCIRSICRHSCVEPLFGFTLGSSVP